MDGWIELGIKLPEPGTEVELMSIATHKGKYEPSSAEQWIMNPDEDVVGNITHWRPLSTNSVESGSKPGGKNG